MEEDRERETVTVNFFEGTPKALWLVALVSSLVLAVGGWLLGFLLPPRGTETHDFTLNIIFFVVAVAGTGIFAICLITSKMRTSKWTADREQVVYSAYGRNLLSLKWSEMQEVGFLKITNPRSKVTAYYLYWTTEELMSACRDFIKGGVMEHKTKYLGRYNRRRGSIILYALDPNDPANDPLVKFTQERYIHQIKNPKILQAAVDASAQS